jgi:hypothetical protein
LIQADSTGVGAAGVSQLSVAVAEPLPTTLVSPPEHWTVVFAGTVNTGFVVSTTLIVWTQVAELLQSSVAVQVRVIVYACGQLPAAVVSL